MTDTVIPKVLVTKIGFDGHDRGSRVVAAGLRDAGMEVIYTPPWQEIDAVVKLATEEDVDVIGISSLATDHLIVPKLMTALREAGLGDVGVVVGGIVPDEDEKSLLEAGMALPGWKTRVTPASRNDFSSSSGTIPPTTTPTSPSPASRNAVISLGTIR